MQSDVSTSTSHVREDEFILLLSDSVNSGRGWERSDLFVRPAGGQQVQPRLYSVSHWVSTRTVWCVWGGGKQPHSSQDTHLQLSHCKCMHTICLHLNSNNNIVDVFKGDTNWNKTKKLKWLIKSEELLSPNPQWKFPACGTCNHARHPTVTLLLLDEVRWINTDVMVYSHTLEDMMTSLQQGGRQVRLLARLLDAHT